MMDARSERALEGVHPDLVAVVRAARETVPFIVTEGLRSPERQRQLVAAGKSRTMNSRHLTGHAIDFVDAQGSYDAARMKDIANAFKAAAGAHGISITWGGDWTSLKDTPHVELSWHDYPADAPAKATVDAAPAPAGKAAVAAAAKQSWTIFGALTGLIGWVMSVFDQAVSVLLEAAAEVAKLGSLASLGVDVKSIGAGLTVGGLVIVILRRLQAAKTGKIG